MRYLATILFFILASLATSSGEITLIPRGATWKYFTAGELPTNWVETGFNDSDWSRGGAQLGYGEGDEQTIIYDEYLPNAPTTVYFRRPFFVTNRFEIIVLTLRMVADDGAVVYLNGKQLLRKNMPSGPIVFNTPALSNVETNENAFAQFGFGEFQLVNGTNIFCVEVHQHPAGREDCSFDLELVANLPLRPPVISITHPSNGIVVPGGDVSIETVSSDTVGHVVMVDFFANGVLVGRSTNEPFSFHWVQPSAGGYSLNARAINELNFFGDSAPVQVYIGNSIAPKMVIEPYLQSGSSTGMVVRWKTDWYSDSVVRYGTNLGQLDRATTNGQLTLNHEVSVGALFPDRRYYYSAGSSTQVLASGSDFYFRTAPTNDRSVRLWAIGDSGTGDQNAASVRDAFYGFNGGPEADLFLMLGDNAYGNSFGWEYQSEVFGMYGELMRHTAAWPTLGNHDAGDTTAETGNQGKPHLDAFTLPKGGECGGVASGTELYYSFDYANMHIVCLDAFLSSRATNGPMLTWLVTDLAATDKDWIIAYWHHPVYSWGSHNSDNDQFAIEMRERAVPILEAYGVDLVMCGHSHDYERSFLIDGHYGHSSTLTSSMVLDRGMGRKDGQGPYRKPAGGLGARQGAVYLVCGCSGEGGDDEGFPLHPVMALNHGGYGSMVIDINGLELTARFLRPSGVVDDIFTINKSLPTTVRPSLELKHATNGVLVSWPTSVPAYTLESVSRLPVGWAAADEAPETFGRRKRFLVPPGSTNRFYRLRSTW